MRTGKRICLGLACITIALGIILVIFAVTFGGDKVNHYTEYTFKLEDTVEEVTSLDFDLSFGTVKIVTGDRFHIIVNNMPEDGYKSYVKDGTWVIENNKNSSSNVNFFGLNIPIYSLGVNIGGEGDITPKVTITIPEDFHAEHINIDMGAGWLTTDTLSGDKITLEVGAGKIEIEELIANNFVKLVCGAGDLVVSELTTKDAEIDCGVGRLKVAGSILGDSEVQCGIGDVSLDLEGNEEDYNYTVDCGIGDVIINDRRYSGTAHTTINNTNTIGSFDLDCGIGRVELNVR